MILVMGIHATTHWAFMMAICFPVNIIQSECRSRSPDIVYGPILTKFGE